MHSQAIAYFYILHWELYEYVCTDHKQNQTRKWQWGTCFKGLRWLHKTPINALRVAWKAIKKALIDFGKRTLNLTDSKMLIFGFH